MRLGIDVGGTNTDAVLMDGEHVVVAVKESTSRDIISGLIRAVERLLADGIATTSLDAVVVGTTHLTNALVERRGLSQVGVLRIGLPATSGLPPQCGWPADLVEATRGEVRLVHGGHEHNGRLISPLDENAIRDAARRFRALGLRSIAITSVFSPIIRAHEDRAAAIVSEFVPDASISLSCDLGAIGLLERENATIINATLGDAARHLVARLRQAIGELRLRAPVFLTQNDGTLLNLDGASRFPVLTFASGLTNSMRGAARLTGLANAIVADIGGTTTDLGLLVNGYPSQANGTLDIGGVRTSFRMPELISLGMGGGSLVHFGLRGEVQVGPRSVGYALMQEGMVFGGATLTATDIAVASGLRGLGDPARLASLPPDWVERADAKIHAMVAEGIDRVKHSRIDAPLVLVGGGSVLIRRELPGAARTIRPPHADVANAIGAAAAEVGAEVDKVVRVPVGERDAIFERLRSEVCDMAVRAGATRGAIRIHAIEESHVAYAGPELRRIRIKALGPLDHERVSSLGSLQ